jgi:glycosyltransferase involved in cell wall biosynthesis
MTADAVGGVWPYTLGLARGLQRMGVDVHVAVMGPPLTGDQRADAARLAAPPAELSCKLEWMNDPWHDLERAGAWLHGLFERVDPDLVHLNGYVHGALVWSVPTVVVAHSCVNSWWRAVHGCDAPSEWDRYRTAVSAGLRNADAVVAPTRAIGLEVERDYGPFRRSHVIANGIARSARRQQPHSRSQLVLSAGRLWDDAKNVATLCAAAGRIDWPVYVAGPTAQDEGRVRNVAGVRPLGRLSRDEMTAWYERAAIYALPARYEPFGLSVLEAASAGCALVLGDIPTLRENWTGAADFVAPDDVDGLAAAIQRLIDDPARRREQSRRASHRARRFTADRMAAAYLTLYRELTAPA